jgi:hypothetical protein
MGSIADAKHPSSALYNLRRDSLKLLNTQFELRGNLLGGTSQF